MSRFVHLFILVVVFNVVGVLGLYNHTNSKQIIVGKPIKAIYIDWHLNWNTPQQTLLDAVNAGFNVVILSFYLSGGTAADMAQAWAALDSSTKQSAIQQAHSKGAVVTVSLGGSTDSPYQHDPYSLGQQVGKWAISQYLDGVDFDVENLNQGFRANGLSDQQTVDWLVRVTQGTSDVMGSGAVISHAPQAPYFGPIGNAQTWTGTTGGYSSVYSKVANAITFFLVQFYNQGSSCYTDYNGLFVSSGPSCPVFPYTAVAEIAKAGNIPLDKIVVGKPVTSADASNGWVSGSTLHSFFQTAQGSMNWNAGVMGWVWNDANTVTSWLHSIYSGTSSGGVTSSGSGTSSTTSRTTSSTSTSTTTTGTTSGGGCSGKATGMFCVDSNHFEWCPQGIIQECAPGTHCEQSGNSILCD